MLTEFEKSKYGSSKALKYIKASGEPVYPISYVTPKPPISKAEKVCMYTPEGRIGLHKKLSIDMTLLTTLMRNPSIGNSAEFNDNKLSLYTVQKGRCAITQRMFRSTEEIHCHHKKPKGKGGTDKYQNLMLVLDEVHKLIHATTDETINKYLNALNLTKPQLVKLNKYREMVGNEPIVA